MKKFLALLLALLLCLSLCACGQSGSYGVQTVVTLVEQDYSIAFRTGDPTSGYVVSALEALSAEGRVDELAMKWFGERIVNIRKNDKTFNSIPSIEPRDLIIGVDIDSFPMAYIANGSYWGFDVELAIDVCDKLGWNLKIQPIEKENVYIELSSGNIDVAWGGIALDPQEIEEGKFIQYGPYVHNDIVIAVRSGTFVLNELMLSGKRLAMSSTPEAMDALNTDPKLIKRLKQVTRLAGGTTECFEYLYAGKADAVLTDSTALYYFNCH